MNLARTRLGLKGSKVIVAALRENKSIKKLNILANTIGEEGYEMFIKAAEDNEMSTLCGFEPGQTHANFCKKDIAGIDLKLIARELADTALESIDLSENELIGGDDSGGIKVFAEALSTTSVLKEVNLLKSKLKQEAADMLVAAVPEQLQTLCGFKAGQEDADLRRMKPGVGDALLVSWDLRAGAGASSIKLMKLLEEDEGYSMLASLAQKNGIAIACGFQEGEIETEKPAEKVGVVKQKKQKMLIKRKVSPFYHATLSRLDDLSHLRYRTPLWAKTSSEYGPRPPHTRVNDRTLPMGRGPGSGSGRCLRFRRF